MGRPEEQTCVTQYVKMAENVERNQDVTALGQSYQYCAYYTFYQEYKRVACSAGFKSGAFVRECVRSMYFLFFFVYIS